MRGARCRSLRLLINSWIMQSFEYALLPENNKIAAATTSILRMYSRLLKLGCSCCQGSKGEARNTQRTTNVEGSVR